METVPQSQMKYNFIMKNDVALTYPLIIYYIAMRTDLYTVDGWNQMDYHHIAAAMLYIID